jgi:hypothetical protein
MRRHPPSMATQSEPDAVAVVCGVLFLIATAAAVFAFSETPNDKLAKAPASADVLASSPESGASHARDGVGAPVRLLNDWNR